MADITVDNLISFPDAGTLLGVTRQAVYDLVERYPEKFRKVAVGNMTFLRKEDAEAALEWYKPRKVG